MAEHSTIEWTDATVNFWWGCTKVGPGCEHCYAEVFDKRVGGAHWGAGVPRRKIKGAVALIHKLDNAYADWAADVSCADGNAKAFGLPYRRHGGLRRRVFIQSMSDLFDLDVPLEWFAEAWDRITRCSRLDIQIVTKRISAVEKRLAAIGCSSWPKHAGLMVTVCNQQEADRDVPRLLALKAKLGIPWVGLSIEPLLGPIDLRNHRVCDQCDMSPARLWRGDPSADPSVVWDDWKCPLHYDPSGGCDGVLKSGIDWVIVGGESGRGARPMHPDWARSLRDQCVSAGVPFFFKQWGDWAFARSPSMDTSELVDARKEMILSHSGGVTSGLMSYARDAVVMRRVGKKAAGRLLDGIEHNGMPLPTPAQRHPEPAEA